jgi:hypothetical protein
MGRPRAFDWDEAKRLRAQGLTYREIGERLGVSGQSVMCACDAAVRRRHRAQSRTLHESYRDPCRGGCGVLVSYRGLKPSTGYCKECWAERVRFEAEMRDSHGTESRYTKLGCRCALCRAAASEAKRKRRERSRVPCSHGCGTLVDAINRRNPGKPPECQPCAMRRIHAERKDRREHLGAAA